MTDSVITTDTTNTPALPDNRITVPDDRINILDNTLCVSVQLRRFGVTRGVRSSQVEVDADRNMIKVTKKILDSPKLKAITKRDSKIRQICMTYALPSSKLFRGGIYCLPAQSAPIVDDLLQTEQALREEECQAFYADYEALCQAAPGQLRALHNTLDYPSLDAVKRCFGMDVSYINIGVPQNLEGVSKSIFNREIAKNAAKITEAADEFKMGLRSIVKELVDHVVERLTPDEANLDPDTGQPKPKKFHASMIEKLNLALELFDSKNVANDTELAALVAKAKAIMNGVDPKALRSNDDLRSYVVREMGTVKTALADMVVVGGGRMYQDVGDDDGPDEEAA